MSRSEVKKSYDEYERIAKRLKENNKSSSEHYETYDEALINFLPEWQRKYCKGNCYKFLCVCLRDFLEKSFSRENQQAMSIAKENFDNYCLYERKNNLTGI